MEKDVSREIEESRWALAKARRDMLLGGRFLVSGARAGRRPHRLAGTRKSRWLPTAFRPLPADFC